MSRAGFRGYISSRPMGGDRVPQAVQNLMVRDYARRKNLDFLLSATEYAMPGCFMMLEQVLDEMRAIGGAILYSMTQLPDDRARRREVLGRALASGGVLHAALEDLKLETQADLARWEDILLVRQALPHCPKVL
jgi:sporadic carbohydrate cluster protein (TIGR04323 family)